MARKEIAIKEIQNIEKEETSRIPAKGKHHTHETAETMAARQRDISVSEFFAKNRHLLGSTTPGNLC